MSNGRQATRVLDSLTRSQARSLSPGAVVELGSGSLAEDARPVIETRRITILRYGRLIVESGTYLPAASEPVTPVAGNEPAQSGGKTNMPMSLVLVGNQGKTLTVAGDAIRIEKKGLLVGNREKTILIRNITSVEVKKPGGFVGFIQFSIAGGNARDSSYTLTGGARGAVADENSVVFNGEANYDIALKVKAYVEAWSPTPRQPQAPSQVGSAGEEIRMLKALLDEGLLTPDEFALKKKQLLGL